MRIEQKQAICAICNHHTTDDVLGIRCEIQEQKPQFDESGCNLFDENLVLKKEQEEKTNKMQSILTQVASRNKRILNFVLDIAFCYTLIFIVSFALAVVVMITSPQSMGIFDNKLFSYAFAFFMIVLYFSTFEYFTGKTIAKYITKTKVVTDTGEKPMYGAILKHSLIRLITFDPLTFLGSELHGWHDSVSKTRVINDSQQ